MAEQYVSDYIESRSDENVLYLQLVANAGRVDQLELELDPYYGGSLDGACRLQQTTIDPSSGREGVSIYIAARTPLLELFEKI
jgi:hypothetical protein